MTTTAPTVLTFRDRLRRRSPPWLQNGRAQRVLYAIGVQLDAFGDALVAGVQLRMPGLYNFDTLPIIGRERRLQRGRNESNATYASRLTRWLIDHRRRGGPYALLSQLYAHYAPNTFPIELIYRNGRRYSMDIAGAVVRDDPGWEIDARPLQWARWWLIFRWPSTIPDGGTWDADPHGANWNDPTSVWNYDITPEEVEDLLLIPREWNAAHPIGHIKLLPPNSEYWDYPLDRFWDETGTWDTAPAAEFTV